MILTIKNK